MAEPLDYTGPWITQMLAQAGLPQKMVWTKAEIMAVPQQAQQVIEDAIIDFWYWEWDQEIEESSIRQQLSRRNQVPSFAREWMQDMWNTVIIPMGDDDAIDLDTFPGM